VVGGDVVGLLVVGLNVVGYNMKPRYENGMSIEGKEIDGDICVREETQPKLVDTYRKHKS